MKTLHDFLSINDIPYDELNVSQKAKMDLFVVRLREAGLEEKILQRCAGDYNYTIMPNQQISTNIPEDLSKEINKVYVHLND